MRRRDFLCGAMAMAGARARPPFRVLYTNDLTNLRSCTSPYHQRGEPFRPEMLEASVDEAVDADAQLLQPGLGWTAWWQSKVNPPEQFNRWFHAQTGLGPTWWLKYLLSGGDFVRIFTARCRRRRVAPFISLRMNDAHHFIQSGGAEVANSCPFYADHPEYRIGTDPKHSDNAELGALNWAIPQVREQKFALLQELAENYDIAGLEMDFMRYPSYFRTNQTTFAERSAIMNGFIAQVRALLDRTAAKGRRRWLSARIPALAEVHDALGFDPAAMHAAGCDILNLSCSYFTEQQTDLAKIRKRAPDAPLYLEMTHTTMRGKSLNGKGGDTNPFLRTTDQQFYTGANLAYQRGASGVSLFNFVYFREFGLADPRRGPFNDPPFHVIGHLGDAAWLAREPQWYAVAQGFVPRGAHGLLPRDFTAGRPFVFKLDTAPPAVRETNGILRLRTEEPPAGRWKASINGRLADAIPYVAKPIQHPYDSWLGVPEQYACFRFPPAGIKDGINEIALELVDKGPVKVVYFDLVLLA